MAEKDLVFVGFNGRAAGLDRKTGKIVWSWTAPSGSGHASLLFDQDALFAAVQGHTYRLDPATGKQIWHNPMSGFGYGVTCIATPRGSTDHPLLASDAQARADGGDGGSAAMS